MLTRFSIDLTPSVDIIFSYLEGHMELEIRKHKHGDSSLILWGIQSQIKFGAWIRKCYPIKLKSTQGQGACWQWVISRAIVYRLNPANINLFKVNNRNTRKRCKIYSKLTVKTPERRHWRHSGVFIVNFEHISYLFLFIIYSFLFTLFTIDSNSSNIY